MKSLTLFSAALLWSSAALAQTTMKDMAADPNQYGGNYLVYPQRSLQKSDIPAGYVPFYISHYGRHGSRYMIDSGDAKDSYNALKKADDEGKLTKYGKTVKDRLQKVILQMDKRAGELTPLGHQQHREIADRMFHNYPQVFAGNANIDCKSTQVVRVILSMGSFCQQLKALNPNLNIVNDASQHDADILCRGKEINHKTSDNEIKWIRKYEHFCDSLSHPARVMGELFTDPNYLNEKRSGRLSRQIFNVACDIQDMPNIDFSLFDVFNDQEMFDYWQSQNAYWYGCFGLSPLQDAGGPYLASNLLKMFIADADSALATGKVAANLRFGHDTGILPLIDLLNINGANIQVNDLRELYKQWNDFRYIPMASNLQLIFFHQPADKKNKDVLVKMMLNEEDVTLPVKPSVGSYYKWADLRKYFEDILAANPNKF